MGTWKPFLWTWAIIVGGMLVAWASGFIITWADSSKVISVGAAVMIMLGLIFGIFIFGGLFIYWLWSPPAYRYAKKHGIAATAKVLAAKKTSWRSKRWIITQRRTVLQQITDEVTGSHPGRRRLIKWEYLLTVLVERPDAMPYETTFYAYLEHPPTQKTKLNVNVHPQKPAVVVLHEDNSGDAVGIFQQRKQ